MRIVCVLGLVAVVVLMSGCAGPFIIAPVIPPMGMAFTSTVAPLDVNVDKTELGTKTGEASTFCVLGLVAFGDASTAAAARDGGLKVINHADYRSLNVLGLFCSYTTIVYGD